ncbi:hypothetical protein BO70DRAFT_365469 [Aspergillus heteromorphus CBS 117.55]|uniref:Guanine nucleotide-exchange factor SEC12 n=1 Tax=Aspergillus heteromorphus CBS 117.55 TaxID=1448321 RepID=A0A317V733_9EURO|nr:uncharacterized protein BO70DRAFT_365469 [Aspergillus heteromorphus CBS 117.55]PWY70174.1 hypothetical protein BO70DRAFT_365469 [Aspergillus heteromorphus CBS 117.55]
MAPTIPSAKLTLSCPLFAADFDPRNPGLLLVAGGGGEGRSGVGNKIALLNTAKRHEISEVVDIHLSRDEDSVTSLASAQTTDDSIVALAGINSSVAEQKRDNNQHLRSFRIDYPPRKSIAASAAEQGGEEKQEEETKKKNKKSPSSVSLSAGKTTPLSRASLFRTLEGTKSSDTYQRILRLSPWKADTGFSRVAAITTGLAPAGEIVFFGVTTTPSASDVIGRIRLNSDEEAEDVDITDLPEQGKFRVAYTNGVDVFVCEISSDTRSNASPDVQCVYTTPLPDKGSRARPKFRALRFLSPTVLLLLQNAPGRTGCELVLLGLHPSTGSEKSTTTGKASIIRRKKLRTTMKIGLGLDICNLGPGSDSDNQQQQAAIAISGSDQSIEILMLEFNPNASRNGCGPLRRFTTLRDVHPFAMTKLCFSSFHPPSHPVAPETPPQYIKLASVSMGNTVVVHTLPLSPCPPASRYPRYVLSMPGESETWTNLTSSVAAIFSILTVCIVLQAFTEIRGATPPYLGATDWLPPNIRDAIARPYYAPLPVLSPHLSPNPKADPPRGWAQSLRDQVTSDHTILIHCNPDTNTLLVDSADQATLQGQIEPGPRRWEELSEENRFEWIQQLTHAGYEPLEPDSDPESILDGVLLGEMCHQLPIEEIP